MIFDGVGLPCTLGPRAHDVPQPALVQARRLWALPANMPPVPETLVMLIRFGPLPPSASGD